MLSMRYICCLCLLLLFLLPPEALAGELSEHLTNYPQWEKITSVKPAEGDLFYPKWMNGNWKVTSTLVDLVAPLAPDLVTPGFDGNKKYLNQPVSFLVRFVPEKISTFRLKSKSSIVADRSFNGLSLARAYLGNDTVIAVKTDPSNPNRQITFLRGEKQLVSFITARATETVNDATYITTEVFQQYFKVSARPYFNIVESTTSYHKLSTENPTIEADQVTAVYLSPQDPDYFKAGAKPVALYRYRLQFYTS